MDITFYNDIENIFTQQRLSVFKQDGVDEITCVARYLYNYERLIHWKDLKDQHWQLLECIKWLKYEEFVELLYSEDFCNHAPEYKDWVAETLKKYIKEQ